LKELALHIMDIAENGIRAGAATLTIALLEEGTPAVLKIRVKDDGKGMEKEELLRVEDPFYTSRTTRRVGMGIPLLRQQAELAAGDLKIKSSPGRGTEVEASFLKDHPDRQPLGDLEGCWILLASVNPGIEWVLHLASGAGEFSISTS
jgi:signal transduction histidine kinase